MKKHSLRSSCTAVFSGFALAFVVIAADAAMDQSREAAFESEKLAYIRQYAWPKRVTSSEHEVLFAKKETTKSAQPPVKDQAPAAPKETSADAPPPPIEGQ